MVMLGGLLLCLGHGILAFDNELSFTLAVLLLFWA